MTLSEDEQNSLDRIEISLAAEDPDFAGRLDIIAMQTSLQRRITVANYGFWFGLVVMMAGTGAARGVLSMGAMAGCYGFLLLVWSAATLLRCRQMADPLTRRNGSAGGYDSRS
jgi:hypothetical protein